MTTAIEGSELVVSQRAVAGGGWLLVAIAFLSVGVIVARGERWPGTVASSRRWATGLLWTDRLAVAFAALSFVWSLTVILRGGWALERALMWVAHLVVTVPEGNVLRAWWFSSLVVALALIAAVGSARPRSIWRASGAAAVVATALYLRLGAPLDQHTKPVPTKVLVPIGGLLLLAASWYLLLFCIARRYQRDSRGGTRIRWIFAFGVLGAAGLAFVHANYLQPRTGLWREVVCLDFDSGRILWQRRAFLAPAGRKHRGNSYATPTPVTDGKYLFAHFGPGMVMMDLDGHVRWKKTVPQFNKYLRYGAGSSPVMHGDLVIFTFMAEGGSGHEGVWEGEHSYLVALDKDSGEEVWRVSPVPQGHDSYGTPLVVRDGGREAVLISTYDHCLAYDADTGEPRWQVRAPLAAPVPSIIADADTAYWTGGLHGPQVAAAIRLGGRGDVTASHLKWKITKGVNGTSSPVLHDGLLYWVTEEGILYGVDAETGELVWRQRLEGSYHGSPIAAGDRIYFPALDGRVTVIEAGRRFKLLAVNSIGEESYSSPAVSRGRLLLRGRKHLFCIGDAKAAEARRAVGTR